MLKQVLGRLRRPAGLRAGLCSYEWFSDSKNGTGGLFGWLEMDAVNTGIKLQVSTGMELQGTGLREVNDSQLHPFLHAV